MEITQAKLKELLDYNSETGVFRWLTGAFKGRIAGTLETSGYRTIGIAYKSYYEHRLAWLWVYGTLPEKIDHKNGMPADNRICNIRECDTQQNNFNSAIKKNNKAGFKGVAFMKNRINPTWRAQIKLDGKQKHLGVFSTAELARDAYIAKAKELHGEFYCER